MKTVIKRLLLMGVSAFLVVIPRPLACQALPVPEYFGVYAVVDGRLLKVDGKEVRWDKNVAVRIGQRNGVGNVVRGERAALPPTTIQVPVLSPHFKIIVFAEISGAQSPLDKAKSLHLESLVFVTTLTINTGWPNNVQRTDMENGWDSGDTVEFASPASGDHAQELEFLVKPLPGQKDMVVAGLADRLSPGVYRLTIGDRSPLVPAAMQGGLLFAVEPVSEGEKTQCVTSLITYSMMRAQTKYSQCSASVQSVQQPEVGASLGGELAPAPEPKSPEDFEKLGHSNLSSGNFDKAVQMWDRALALGGSLTWQTCHQRAMDCEHATFTLSSREATFTPYTGKGAITVSTGEAIPAARAALVRPLSPSAYFRLKMNGKNYNFDFWPDGHNCLINTLYVQCDDDGFAQQKVVANYIIRKLSARQ